MAREFILFVQIYHWLGGETEVPFKTSPGLLTECHGGKMNTSGEWGWGAGVAPLPPTPIPGGCTNLAVGCFSSFSPWNTKFLSSLDSTFPEGPHKYGHVPFLDSAHFCGFFCMPETNSPSNPAGEQEKERGNWAPSKACRTEKR